MISTHSKTSPHSTLTHAHTLSHSHAHTHALTLTQPATPSLSLSLCPPSPSPSPSTHTDTLTLTQTLSHTEEELDTLVCASGRVYELCARVKKTLYGEIRSGYLLTRSHNRENGYTRTNVRVAVKCFATDRLAHISQRAQATVGIDADDVWREIEALDAIRAHLSHTHTHSQTHTHTHKERAKRPRTNSLSSLSSLTHHTHSSHSTHTQPIDAHTDPHTHTGLPDLLDVHCEAHTVYVVMRCAPGVELIDLITQHPHAHKTHTRSLTQTTQPTRTPHRPLCERVVSRVMSGLLQALRVTHSLSLSHRDVSLENVLYDPHTHRVTLVDFGLARSVCDTHSHTEVKRMDRKRARCESESESDSRGPMPNTLCGKTMYLPPESTPSISHTQAHALPPTVCGYARDVWACGVVAASLLFGGAPFERASCEDARFRALFGLSHEEDLLRSLCVQWGVTLSNEALAFLRRALCVNEGERASVEELLQCEFVRKYNICERDATHSVCECAACVYARMGDCKKVCEREWSPCSFATEDESVSDCVSVDDCERVCASEKSESSAGDYEYAFVDAAFFL